LNSGSKRKGGPKAALVIPCRPFGRSLTLRPRSRLRLPGRDRSPVP
jgi:hypothetical protein